MIDIKENHIYKLDDELLKILLKDRSSNKNIIWATDNYKSLGDGYYEFDEITIKSITGRNSLIVKPRIEKSQKEQSKRIKDKAEVFTPSWVCNVQNNLVDNTWFKAENIFNFEEEKNWTTNHKKIVFPKEKTWQDYVNENRLEMSCGEAPYLCSRYDTVTGKWIEIIDRIGLLDRKLRIINENTNGESEWLKWTIRAYETIYGFEWQGDSLLIARENLLFTFIDYFLDRFTHFPNIEYIKKIAEILSWNIFQMDGLKFVIPNSCKPVPKMQMSLFEDYDISEECPGCKNGDNNMHTGIYTKIMDWEIKKPITFISLLNKQKEQKS